MLGRIGEYIEAIVMFLFMTSAAYLGIGAFLSTVYWDLALFDPAIWHWFFRGLVAVLTVLLGSISFGIIADALSRTQGSVEHRRKISELERTVQNKERVIEIRMNTITGLQKELARLRNAGRQRMRSEQLANGRAQELKQELDSVSEELNKLKTALGSDRCRYLTL